MGKYRKNEPPSRSSYTQAMKTAKRAKKQQHGKGRKVSKSENIQAKTLVNFLQNISLYNVISSPEMFSKQLIRAIIERLSRVQLGTITRLVRDVVSGKLAIPKPQLQKFENHKEELRNFHHLNIQGKKQYLTQKGGFLPILIPILTGLLSTAAKEGISALAHMKHHKKRRRR